MAWISRQLPLLRRVAVLGSGAGLPAVAAELLPASALAGEAAMAEAAEAAAAAAARWMAEAAAEPAPARVVQTAAQTAHLSWRCPPLAQEHRLRQLHQLSAQPRRACSPSTRATEATPTPPPDLAGARGSARARTAFATPGAVEARGRWVGQRKAARNGAWAVGRRSGR